MRRSQEPSDMLLTFGDNKRSYLLYDICFHQALKGYGLFLKILSFSREILYLVKNLKLYSYIFHCILLIFEKVIHFNYFFKSDSLAWLKTILFLTFQCLTPWCNGFFYPVFLLTANPTVTVYLYYARHFSNISININTIFSIIFFFTFLILRNLKDFSNWNVN